MRRLAVTLPLVLLILGCGEGESSGSVRRADGARVIVEVLNASGRRGLARIGTRELRREGLDVVYYGTADTTVDSTLILVRRGPLAAGHRVLRALGAGRVREAPDPLPRVDVTVLLGPDWRPPPDPRP